MLNAVYFKGDWLSKFNVHCTNDQDFYISPNETVNVKMMYTKEDFLTGANDELNCQAIELPYEGER